LTCFVTAKSSFERERESAERECRERVQKKERAAEPFARALEEKGEENEREEEEEEEEYIPKRIFHQNIPFGIIWERRERGGGGGRRRGEEAG
jgi:hypothetical protein